MDTEGFLAPETVAEARRRYGDVRPAAETVVREIRRATALDDVTTDDVTTDDLADGAVIETAHDAVFASLLEVRVGTRAEFAAFREGRDDEVIETGSEHVEHVVWHAPPFADRIVAATFAEAREAAVATLRRQAFGRLYRDRLPVEADAGGSTGGE